MYAPTVNDLSGQIMSPHMIRSAETRAAGDQAMTQGMLDGASSVVNGVVKGVKDYISAKEEGDALNMTVDFLKQNSPGFRETFTPEMEKKFHEGNIASKRALASQGQTMFLKDLQLAGQKDYLGAQTAANANYSAFKQGLTVKPTPSQNELDQMSEAGYVWNSTEKKFETDRSKFRSQNPMDALLGGAPSPDLPGTAPATTPQQTAGPSSSAAPKYKNGQTATMPDGSKRVFKNGTWEPI